MMKPANYAPIYACVYAQLAEIARSHGYAMAAHGSLAADFDLVCIPWVEGSSDPQSVIDEITSSFCIEQVGKPEAKEHGRVAYTISFSFGECRLDLSFMPTVAQPEPGRVIVPVECNCPGGSKPNPEAHAPNCPIRKADSLPAAGSAAKPYPDDVAADLERSDWTPEEALRWYAAGRHFDVVGGRTRIIDTGAVASNALKHVSLPYLEMKGDAELSELRGAISADQSVPERVSVPRELLELLERIANNPDAHTFIGTEQRELRALLHGASEDEADGEWNYLQSIMDWTAAENVPDDRKLCLIRNAARAGLERVGSSSAMTVAARDVLAERQRQITTEGWTTDHDDEHDGGEMAAAGAAYALHAADYLNPQSQGDGGDEAPDCWPWHDGIAGRAEGQDDE